MVNFEVAGSSSYREIPKNHFVMAAADIDDSIKRKRIRTSFKKSLRYTIKKMNLIFFLN